MPFILVSYLIIRIILTQPYNRKSFIVKKSIHNRNNLYHSIFSFFCSNLYFFTPISLSFLNRFSHYFLLNFLSILSFRFFTSLTSPNIHFLKQLLSPISLKNFLTPFSLSTSYSTFYFHFLSFFISHHSLFSLKVIRE